MPTVWVVLFDPDKSHILLGRRAEKCSNAGKWNLFGGRIDPGETMVQAARRELIEETGIKAALGQFRFLFMAQGHAYYMLPSRSVKKLQATAETVEYKWVPMNLSPDDTDFGLHAPTQRFFAQCQGATHGQNVLSALSQIDEGGLDLRNVPEFEPVPEDTHRILGPVGTKKKQNRHITYGVRQVGRQTWGTAEDGLELAGWYNFRPFSRLLADLTVRSAYRGMGLSRGLLDHAVKSFGYPIRLHAGAFSPKLIDGSSEPIGPSTAQLRDFYMRYGFQCPSSDPNKLILLDPKGS